MGDVIVFIALLAAFTVGALIAVPLAIVFFERVYGPFCEWVWDLFGA